MATDLLDRRSFLKNAALGLGITACSFGKSFASQRAHYVGVETDALDRSRLVYFSPTGASLGSTRLDFRAHGMAENGDRLIVFPRRPGNRFAVVQTGELQVLSTVQAPANRHFFGHGAFTKDGNFLIVPENDMDTLQGAVAIYEIKPALRRMGTITLPGPGPHEVVRHPNSDVFFIALGGLETHPDYGRDPLNADSFQSQILRYDFHKGSVEPLGLWPGTERVSLRHLAFDGLGRLYVGGQVPTLTKEAVPVLWLVTERGAQALETGPDLANYVSSVAADGNRALISSKQSGTVLELNGADVIQKSRLTGASALALKDGHAVKSGFHLLEMGSAKHSVQQGYEFDNHGIML
ncbi:MAG: DUF1513 domain-containing protein [Pseudomonadota bacterium]